MIVDYQAYEQLLARRLQEGKLSSDRYIRCAEKLMEWDLLEWEDAPTLEEAHDPNVDPDSLLPSFIWTPWKPES